MDLPGPHRAGGRRLEHCFPTRERPISFISERFKPVSSKSAGKETVWISRGCFGSVKLTIPSLRERRTFPRCTTSYPPCLPPRPHRRSPTFPMPPVSCRGPAMCRRPHLDRRVVRHPGRPRVLLAGRTAPPRRQRPPGLRQKKGRRRWSYESVCPRGSGAVCVPQQWSG